MNSLTKGRGASKKSFFFYFLYVEKQKQSFQPYFLISTVQCEKPFVDNSIANPTTFSTEKNIIPFKLSSGHFVLFV